MAVAFDGAPETGASATGLADRASGRRATPDDPVRIASISKLVVAIGVMRLVEQGKLDLDRPVGDYLGYTVENPAFPGQPVTLRRLLSHTGSLRDHDDQYAIPLGGTLRAVLGDAASWDSAHGPGAGYFAYANVNFPVVASIVERVTNTRFDHVMKRLVLDPMKLDACFNWPLCSDAAVARAVVLMQDGAGESDIRQGVMLEVFGEGSSDGPLTDAMERLYGVERLRVGGGRGRVTVFFAGLRGQHDQSRVLVM